jgi:uncharacterized protein YdeI (YjbR/CyaY-like superfamily)
MAPAAPRFFATAAAFGAWLKAHAAQERELLVGFHKVGSGRPSMTWPEAVDEALCVGWIDGVRKRVDEHTYTIRFTPRKPGSIWSAINIAKVQRLQAEGRMTEAGLQAFAQRTEARSVVYSYEQAEAAELSPDELRAFKRHKAAWAYFEACPPGYRHQMLYRVTSAKKAQTRQRRLDLLIAACSEGRRLA